MLSFSLDNVQYEAKALGAWLGTRNRGVFSAGSNLAVSTAGGMQVSVASGLAWLKNGDLEGTICMQDNEQSFTIPAADAQLSRLDVVCVQLDKSVNKAAVIIKKGTPNRPLQLIVYGNGTSENYSYDALERRSAVYYNKNNLFS